MELLIFKTNIQDEQRMQELGIQFSQLSCITSWSLDSEDSDKVLKVNTDLTLNSIQIQALINSYGFVCEELE